MTDIELIRLFREGDNAAWEELYKTYKPLVLKIARSFFLYGSDTEDLVQEGMWRLFSAVQSYRAEDGDFLPYAYRCVYNRIVDVVKKSNADKQVALNNFLPIEDGKEVRVVNPEDEIISEEDREEFYEKLQKFLSPLEYRVITLYVKGNTMAEMSSTINKDTKSIDNAITRAKQKILKNFSAEK